MDTRLRTQHQPHHPTTHNAKDHHQHHHNGGGAGTPGAKPKDLTDLPLDLFLLITRSLPPRDCVRCRRVGRAWRNAFTGANACYRFAAWHFPRSREMRDYYYRRRYRRRAGDGLGGLGEGEEREEEKEEGDDEDDEDDERGPDWPRVFADVARRYHFLRSARPRVVEKIDVTRVRGRAPAKDRTGTGLEAASFRGVAPWDRWLEWNEHRAVFQHGDPAWCVDAGALVYREPGAAGAAGRYVVYDLDTRRSFRVPFETAGRTVRRLRLAEGVLVFEWCETEPWRRLHGGEAVYRHFATAFDVQRRKSSSSSLSESESGPESSKARFSWTITFRSEWKIHSLGLPVNNTDRFFSTHTATHYALYLWQPGRSPWRADDIDDIDDNDDAIEYLTIWDISAVHQPTVVNRFSSRALEHLGLRQRHTPSLRALALDAANVYVHEEDHRWLAGRHAPAAPPRHHLVRCTGVPLAGAGPRWRDECCADGDVHMSFCPRAGSLARVLGGSSSSSNIGRGSGLGSERAGGGVEEAQPAGWWPGWAPCWRHDEFPYLTVADAVDAGAGVRFVARQCFVVEALSSFVVPKISVLEEREVVGEAGDRERGDGDDDDDEGEIEDMTAVAEVRFADEMWWELMAKGTIAGDERWVVGEDGIGRITVMRF